MGFVGSDPALLMGYYLITLFPGLGIQSITRIVSEKPPVCRQRRRLTVGGEEYKTRQGLISEATKLISRLRLSMTTGETRRTLAVERGMWTSGERDEERVVVYAEGTGYKRRICGVTKNKLYLW